MSECRGGCRKKRKVRMAAFDTAPLSRERLSVKPGRGRNHQSGVEQL